MSQPTLYVIAGPNGAGKTDVRNSLLTRLRQVPGVFERGLSHPAEIRIQRALVRRRAGRRGFIIAHRLNTIRHVCPRGRGVKLDPV